MQPDRCHSIPEIASNRYKFVLKRMPALSVQSHRHKHHLRHSNYKQQLMFLSRKQDYEHNRWCLIMRQYCQY